MQRPDPVGSTHLACIWCNRNFDYVPRSNEHIIPQSLFGRFQTQDVCAPCNSRLGSQLDVAFLHDGPTIEAARQAGVPLEKLLFKYRTRSITADGIEVFTAVSGTESRVIPNFRDPQRSIIGDHNGVFDPGQLAHQKTVILQKVLGRGTRLREEEIQSRIETLYANAAATPGTTVMDLVIGESLRFGEHIPLQAEGKQADPILVSRAAGKMLYEFLKTLPPSDVQAELAAPLSQLKDFVQGVSGSSNVVGHKLLSRLGRPRHVISIQGNRRGLLTEVQLFSKICWSIRVSGAGPRTRVFQVTKTNSF